MSGKETQPNPEFTIGADDDDATNMSAMPVTNPSLAPTLDQIQNETTYPDIAAVPSASSSFTDPQGTDRSMFGPSGRWKHGIFSCFGAFFSALFWMGLCCVPCVYGQLAQRMNLTWLGTSPPQGQRAAGTCMAVFIFASITYLFMILFSGWIVTLIWYLFCFYFFFMGILLRSTIRKRFGIAPNIIPVLDGVMEDFLLAFCCSCCSAIQMARHTHDEDRYPYNGCSNNGLLSYAPDLWDDILQHDDVDAAAYNNPHSTDGSRPPPSHMSNIEIV